MDEQSVMWHSLVVWIRFCFHSGNEGGKSHVSPATHVSRLNSISIKYIGFPLLASNLFDIFVSCREYAWNECEQRQKQKEEDGGVELAGEEEWGNK